MVPTDPVSVEPAIGGCWDEVFFPAPHRLIDPCRLERQVKEILWLEVPHAFRQDPCRFIRQVNQIFRL